MKWDKAKNKTIPNFPNFHKHDFKVLFLLSSCDEFSLLKCDSTFNIRTIILYIMGDCVGILIFTLRILILIKCLFSFLALKFEFV
jgi:hypothetical protein